VDTLRHRIIVGGKMQGKLGSAPAEFHYPSAAVIVDDRAYVADSWNHRVQVFTLPDWKFAFEFGDFFCPKWLGVVSDRGRTLIVVVDTNNCRLCFHEPDGRRVRVFDFHSRMFPVAARILDSDVIEVAFDNGAAVKYAVSELIHSGWWTTKLQKPISIVRDAEGYVYVSDFGRRTVEKFDADGEFVAEILGPDVLTLPGKMAINGTDLLVTDRPANSIWIVDTRTNSNRRWICDFGPGVIGKDSGDAIWVAPYKLEPDAQGTSFLVFDSHYRFLRTIHLHELRQPTSLAFMGDRVFVADQDARNVLVYGVEGNFQGALRPEPYPAPVWAVTQDGDGYLYTGVGSVVDILFTPELRRLYYIDFEAPAVRYHPAP
jgi:sugar lactone lactonase YvrE